MKLEITWEQLRRIKEAYIEGTKHINLGERDDMGYHDGATDILDILEIEIEGVNK